MTTGDGFRTLFRLAASIPSLPLPLRPNPTLAPPPPLATTDFFALPQSQQAPAPSSSSSTTVTNAAASGGGGGDAESDLKSLTRLAYLLLTDLHRTIAPLSYPPHTCAAACIYLAGYLLCSAAAAAAASQQQISDERAQEEEGRDGGAGAGSGAVWDEEMEQNWAGMCESEPDDISGQFSLSLAVFHTRLRIKADERASLFRHFANATRPAHLALSSTTPSRSLIVVSFPQPIYEFSAPAHLASLVPRLSFRILFVPHRTQLCHQPQQQRQTDNNDDDDDDHLGTGEAPPRGRVSERVHASGVEKSKALDYGGRPDEGQDSSAGGSSGSGGDFEKAAAEEEGLGDAGRG